ncbi:uncharacterized protein LY89DRAFT_758473 [Mollisia scopiformis]|uniref:Amidoligase enzyme-domain-containing protein n=1 Tax=Mollisia scopiformis TaxID=149040 RepID=A0A194WUQ5_MOLSC|nr:uncharacterized protein LY89DRAFT_758473 [Mollisia scopiformis]KUJ11680.1 hypothetical protein LY89DRAFT_758473 [Mollisia scopiformis]
MEIERRYHQNHDSRPSPRFLKFPISIEAITKALNDAKLTNKDGSKVIPAQVDSGFDSVRSGLLLLAAKHQIGANLVKSSLAWDPQQEGDLGDPEYWSIGEDTSIDTSKCDPDYFWYRMEITSPALKFSKGQSMTDVRRVCDILSQDYLTVVNTSCNLHVHFSYGRILSRMDEGDQNPAFDSMDTHWLASAGIKIIRSALDLPALTKLISQTDIFEGFSSRDMSVSIHHITHVLYPGWNSSTAGDIYNDRLKRKRHTVEFRLYEGTLDKDKVEHWIKTLGGIINWLENYTVEELERKLMQMLPRMKETTDLAPQERGSEEGQEENGEDRNRKAMGGEGLAGKGKEKQSDEGELGGGTDEENGCRTVIDILEQLGLQCQADFYRDKLYLHADALQWVG